MTCMRTVADSALLASFPVFVNPRPRIERAAGERRLSRRGKGQRRRCVGRSEAGGRCRPRRGRHGAWHQVMWRNQACTEAAAVSLLRAHVWANARYSRVGGSSQDRYTGQRCDLRSLDPSLQWRRWHRDKKLKLARNIFLGWTNRGNFSWTGLTHRRNCQMPAARIDKARNVDRANHNATSTHSARHVCRSQF